MTARLAPSARQDLTDIREAYRNAGGDALRLNNEILATIETLSRRPYIGHQRPDVTDHPDLLFFPTASEMMLVYRPDPFLLLFVILPWSELEPAFRRRMARHP